MRATALAADTAQAITLDTTLHTSACDPDGCKTSVSGATTIDFNGGTAPSTGFASYSYSGGTLVRSGGVANVAAPPYGDTSPYVSIGPSPNASPVTITFQSPLDYFGLYWGSTDNYNSISFYKNVGDANPVQTFTGSDVRADANGGQTVNEQNPYVDFNSENSNDYFQKVVLSSSNQAFENDNHAYRKAVPYNFSPGVGILALGAWGATAQLKSKVQKRKTSKSAFSNN